MLRRLLGYAAYMAGTTSMVSLVGFVVSLWGFKTRTRDNVGDYYTYVLIYGVLQSLLISGVNAIVQKVGADDARARVRFAKLAYVVFAVLLLGLSSIGLIAALFDRLSYALAFLGVPWIVVWWWAQYILRSQLDYRWESRLVIFASVANSLFQFGFLTFTRFDDALIYGSVIALVCSGLLALLVLPHAAGASWREIMKAELPAEFLAECRRMLVPLWWSGQIFTLNQHLAGGFIRARLGSASMGSYGVMESLLGFANKPLEFLKTASLPGLVQAGEERALLLREIARIFFVTYPILVLGVAAGSPLVFELTGMGDKWREVPFLLLATTLGAAPHALEMVINQYAVALGEPKVQLRSQIVQAVVQLAVLVPAIHYFGVYGAIGAGVVATLAQSLTYVVLLWRIDRDSMRTVLIWLGLSMLGLSAGVWVAYVALADPGRWWVAFPLLVGWLGYCFLVRLLKPADLSRLARAVRAAVQSRRRAT